MTKPEPTENIILNKNCPLLNLAQYTSSLLVILIHCGRLSENDIVHFTLKVFFGRLAVPLFLVTAGYFFCLKQNENPDYARSYFKRQWQVYLFWSLIYLPYGVWFVQNIGLDPKLYLAALPVGIGYLGFCYHLWYFPALFLGFFLTRKLVKHVKFPITCCVCMFLFTLGATETYAAYLQGTRIHTIYTLYQQLFFTTRNGLFYAPIFLLIGFFLASASKYHLFLQKYKWQGLIISLLLLSSETILVCLKQGTDKNFLFSLIPASLFLMNLLLRSTFLVKRNFSQLRKNGQSLYFLHPLFLEGIQWVFKQAGIADFQGIPLFLITFALTTLSVKLLIVIKTQWTENIETKKLRIFRNIKWRFYS
ncbi:acyltransferase [Enterococcus raffinosus]|uniref:acyltransferase family protein n=1 Tax=Enterococcus raffinosus TaxID=71452 RepID=UPI001C109404|nr:acyltransferase [Enterococcus raffinosus]MBU5363634.1 acyltransferase [Enterococcus raffinosus]